MNTIGDVCMFLERKIVDQREELEELKEYTHLSSANSRMASCIDKISIYSELLRELSADMDRNQTQFAQQRNG